MLALIIYYAIIDIWA